LKGLFDEQHDPVATAQICQTELAGTSNCNRVALQDRMTITSTGIAPRFCRKAVNCRDCGAVLGFIQPGRANKIRRKGAALEGM
jgi:hypothetical protein